MIPDTDDLLHAWPREPHTPAAGPTEPTPLSDSALSPAPGTVLMSLLQPGALFLLDARGEIVSVGGAWEELVGFSGRDLLGQPLSGLLTGDAHGALLFAASRGQANARLRAQNGERRVRVTWRREHGWTAGNIESLAPAARAAFQHEQAAQEWQLAVDALVRALGKHVGGWEAAHVERVAGFAERFGETLHLTPEQSRALRWGAYLHDVGKAGIPDCILLKDAPLTPCERAVVQQHPADGHALLRELPFLPLEVREMVLHHHERWDGGGYPSGLRGEHIPFFARVLAVVDVFDALTSERSYKVAWDYREAAEYLVREAGRHFDPQLVAGFVGNVLRLPELLKSSD